MPAKTTTSVLEAIQAPATPSSLETKDSRELYRSRKLNLKPHDRAKAHTNTKQNGVSRLPKETNRKTLHFASSEDDVTDFTVKDVKLRIASSAPMARPNNVYEVPILTIMRSSQPWDGIGADFELISNPDEVIALDGDVDYSDDEWENVDEFNQKVNSARSYATALKCGL